MIDCSGMQKGQSLIYLRNQDDTYFVFLVNFAPTCPEIFLLEKETYYLVSILPSMHLQGLEHLHH